MASTYTVKQVAELLGYSTNSIYTFIKDKRIRAVRVGKGRFRISQREVNRLLQSEKSVQPETASLASGTPPQVSELSQSPPAELVRIYENESKIAVPGLIDWFLGISSIVFGLSMTLFSGFLGEFAYADLGGFIVPLRTACIAGGAGLLLSDVTGKNSGKWRSVFLTVIFLSFLFLSGVSLVYGEYTKASLLGPVVIAAFLVLFLRSGSLPALSVLAALYVILFLLVVLRSAYAGSLVLIPAAIPARVALVLWGAISGAYSYGLYWSYKHNSRIYWGLVCVASGVLAVVSVWLSLQAFWGSALVVLACALTLFFIPTWQTLQFTHKSDRTIAFSTFGTILSIFLLALIVIRTTESNVLSYAQNQLENKAVFGSVMLSQIIKTTRASLSGAAGNDVILSQLKRYVHVSGSGLTTKQQAEDDTRLLSAVRGVLRGVYEGNDAFQRVYLINSEGRVVATYPHEVSAEGTDLSYRDYVQRVFSTKSGVITHSMDSHGNHIGKAIVLAEPVMDEDTEKPIGIIVGTLHVLSLGDKLQQLATPEMDEYFVVVGEDRAYLIHPDIDTLHMRAEDEQFKNIASLRVVSSIGKDTRGDVVMGSMTGMEYPPWSVGVYAPIVRIVSVTGMGTFVIVGVLIFSLVVVYLFGLLKRQQRLKILTGRSSP